MPTRYRCGRRFPSSLPPSSASIGWNWLSGGLYGPIIQYDSASCDRHWRRDHFGIFTRLYLTGLLQRIRTDFRSISAMFKHVQPFSRFLAKQQLELTGLLVVRTQGRRPAFCVIYPLSSTRCSLSH